MQSLFQSFKVDLKAQREPQARSFYNSSDSFVLNTNYNSSLVSSHVL